MPAQAVHLLHHHRALMQRGDGVLQPQRANADGNHVSVYSTGALARALSTSFLERHAEERFRLCSSHLTTGMQRVAADTKRGHGWRSRDREGTRRMKGGFCASAWNAARFQVTHDQLKKPRRGALAGGPACASTRCSVRMSLSSPALETTGDLRRAARLFAAASCLTCFNWDGESTAASGCRIGPLAAFSSDVACPSCPQRPVHGTPCWR